MADKYKLQLTSQSWWYFKDLFERFLIFISTYSTLSCLHRVLQHPNILQCLGQCVEAIPFLLVFEYCEMVSVHLFSLPSMHKMVLKLYIRSMGMKPDAL